MKYIILLFLLAGCANKYPELKIGDKVRIKKDSFLAPCYGGKIRDFIYRESLFKSRVIYFVTIDVSKASEKCDRAFVWLDDSEVIKE